MTEWSRRFIFPIRAWFSRRPRLVLFMRAASLVLLALLAVGMPLFEPDIQGALVEGGDTTALTLAMAAVSIALLLDLLALLLPLPSIPMTSLEELARQHRLAVSLYPDEDWETWSYEAWKSSLEQLSLLIERGVSSLHAYGNGSELDISVNLMVELHKSTTQGEFQRLWELVREEDDQELCSYYFPNKDDISGSGQLRAHLVMVGRTESARMRTYEPLRLRVHRSHRKALPGAPMAYHLLRKALKEDQGAGRLSYSYLPNTKKIQRSSFPPDVSQTARNAMRGYFQSHSDVSSFLSVGLAHGGETVGVLNIDCAAPNLLGGPALETAILASLEPVLPVAAALARVFLMRNNEWR